jgi:hypothetical protein
VTKHGASGARFGAVVSPFTTRSAVTCLFLSKTNCGGLVEAEGMGGKIVTPVIRRDVMTVVRKEGTSSCNVNLQLLAHFRSLLSIV